MAAKDNKAAKSSTKLGHRISPAAAETLALLAAMANVSEAAMIEGLIRAAFDRLPEQQKAAIGTFLRAKGLSVRDLRKANDQQKANEETTETALAEPAGRQGAESTPAQAPTAPVASTPVEPSLPPAAPTGKTPSILDGLPALEPGERLDQRTAAISAKYLETTAVVDAAIHDTGGR